MMAVCALVLYHWLARPTAFSGSAQACSSQNLRVRSAVNRKLFEASRQLCNVHDNHAHVIFPAMRVRKRDEMICGVLRISSLQKSLGELRISNHARQSIATKQYNVLTEK